MALRDNFDPDLIYEVVWSGGELLPPRPERTSSSWGNSREERRRYVQSGNHRSVGGEEMLAPSLPSMGEDVVIVEELTIQEDIKSWRIH